MQARWTKTTTGESIVVEPLTMAVERKGDGRWNWRVTKAGTRNPIATGVASSLGAAKTACEQFAKRAGLS
jgi:hypothetical protein